MANRVLFGKRGSDYGLFVSKPGANVISCDPEDMLFDSRRKEIVSNPFTSGTGTVTFSGTSSASNYLNTDNDNNFGSGRLMRFTFQDGTQTAVDGFMKKGYKQHRYTGVEVAESVLKYKHWGPWENTGAKR